MANQMPIYSQVVPKSQYRANKTKSSTKERTQRNEFDPLNHNNGGQFVLNSNSNANDPKSERRKPKEEVRKRNVPRIDPTEGKVEAYLRQNQVSMRQQQHRHSAVRQAEHRVNLRSLPLNDALTQRNQDRTPSDKHRAFPGDRDAVREHRRERDKDRNRDYDCDDTPYSPLAPRASQEHRMHKSSSSQKVQEPAISVHKRRFFCREWVFQKIAHCLEQRPISKTCGSLILGDAGSGKSALCLELSEPGQGPQARQQRALNRRMLARHFLQANTETSLRPSEFIRSLAMQLLSHSTKHRKDDSPMDKFDCSSIHERRNSEDESFARRFKDLADDGEESSKPLLADSEDQRTDEEDTPFMSRRKRQEGIIEENANELPEILPRTSAKTTNPFLSAADETKETDFSIYENHENVFLRNLSQRQSKDARNSRLVRQSSEPLTEKKNTVLQKSLSTEQKNESNSETEKSKTDSPPKISRIPVANFRYPNKSDLRSNSVESSPQKTSKITEEKKVTQATELPEYQNVLKPTSLNFDTEMSVRDTENVTQDTDKVTPDSTRVTDSEDVPPPIPSLPVNPRTLIANAYYEKLLSEPEIQQALLPQNLDKNPDECFKKALLFPLLEIDPPKQCLFLLVDAIDEGCSTSIPTKDDKPDSSDVSKTVASLLAKHQHLFPQWLLLVCTARKHSKQCTKMFTGFRKITLDELQRAHVSADVQRYVLARLDSEPRLRSRVSSDSTAAAAAAAALDHLRIKSDGCLLYLEKVLDGVADGFIALREIKEIPGTLNGLYLWLAQRLFHGRRFTKVRLLLDVLLAARCGVTEDMLYKCLLTKEYSVSREDFNRRLHLLRRIVVLDRRSGHVRLFHHSFARWLLDVKHCTRRYLCAPHDGDAALAMYYTLDAKRLTALEVHNFVLHMTNLEQHMTAQKKGKSSAPPSPVDAHTLMLLWVLDSGCDVEAALRREPDVLHHHDQQTETKLEDQEEELEADKDSISGKDQSPLESLMPSLSIQETDQARWKDARVMKALMELSRDKSLEVNENLPFDDDDDEEVPQAADDQLGEEFADETLPMTNDSEPEQEEVASPVIEPVPLVPLDPHTLADLVATADDDTLVHLIEHQPCPPPAGLLQLCARSGRASAVRALLAGGASPDRPDADGWTALRAAAWAGHAEVVDVLLEYGCDVDCVDADNRTALRAAAWSGHLPVAARLVQAGATDKPDREGRTPLTAAAYMGHRDIAALLLAHGAHIDHADEDGRTALAVASLCASGAACVALLLEKGADVNKADKDGATPLLVAAFEGHTEICELLLEAEADLERADAAGRTALWAAAAAGHAPAVRLLLYWGAGVDHMDDEGRTVLSTAAAQGNVEVVRQLLDRGLDEHHRDNSGWTPLHYAAFEGHIEVCEALLEAGAKVDEADNDGKGPLLLAAQEGHTRLVELLIDDWKAPLDQRAHDGKTALRLAALEGHAPAVLALHSRGADVDAVDADRRTTLYVLALDNRLSMARFLITECGANVDSRDAEGRTPLHVSAWQGHNDMVNLLIKVGGASVEGRDRCLRSALHAASWRGRAPVLRSLLRAGADHRAVCTQGATPLGIAAQEGHEECVMLLLQHGADPLQADHCGRTPAKVAWRAGHVNICRLLERSAPQGHMTQMTQVTQVPSAPLCHAPLATNLQMAEERSHNSPDCKRRSVHSSSSTKSSSNLTTTGSGRSHELAPDQTGVEKGNRANLSLSFAQQVSRCGRVRRDVDKDNLIPENRAVEKDPNLRSYLANERDADIRGYERDSRREVRRGYGAYERDNMSPLYASPPRSPVSDVCSPTVQGVPFGTQPPSLTVQPVVSDNHFNRDTHMRIILGRESKPTAEKNESEEISRGRQAYRRIVGSLGRARGRIFKKTPKNKRNGIVTNPAMRLVANVRNGLDSAAANIRRTGVALAASASSANPAVKTNAFQWRKETPL